VKVLAASDLHYALPQFDWLVARAVNYDMVVIAGDMLDLASAVEPDVQILVVTRYLESLSERTVVAVCSGNHDGDVRVGEGEFAAQWLLEMDIENVHVDGETFFLGEDKVTICPWWEGDASRDRMVAMLRAESRSARQGRRWIWLHHAPPDACPVSWTGKVYGGDAFLNGLIDELHPDIVLSGHIHNAPFYAEGSWATNLGGTWVFNAGRQIGPIPAFITLDLDALEARYRNMYDVDTRELGAAPAGG